MGALNRVYLNIGLYSEDWMTHFNPFFGGKKISPIEIATAEKGSPYWKATEIGTYKMAAFLLKAGQPDPLEKAPGGKDYLTASAATLDRGKIVFAETCARCHSSKLPDEARAKMDGGCSGPGYLDLLEPLLGLYQDRRVQGQDARDRAEVRFPRGQLSVDRRPYPGDAAADQRLQPARHQCDPRQHLGQFLVVDLQDPSFGRHRSPCRIPSTGSAGNSRCRAADAASRACPRW